MFSSLATEVAISIDEHPHHVGLACNCMTLLKFNLIITSSSMRETKLAIFGTISQAKSRTFKCRDQSSELLIFSPSFSENFMQSMHSMTLALVAISSSNNSRCNKKHLWGQLSVAPQLQIIESQLQHRTATRIGNW